MPGISGALDLVAVAIAKLGVDGWSFIPLYAAAQFAGAGFFGRHGHWFGDSRHIGLSGCRGMLINENIPLLFRRRSLEFRI
jgi:hypothetical protein